VKPETRFDFVGALSELNWLLTKVGYCNPREMIGLIEMDADRFCMMPYFVYHLDCFILADCIEFPFLQSRIT